MEQDEPGPRVPGDPAPSGGRGTAPAVQIRKKVNLGLLLIDFYMVSDMNKNRVNLAKKIKIFFMLDAGIFILLLLIFPNLWFIGFIFALIVIGMIVSYLIYEDLLKYGDTTWIRPAEILGTVTVGLNAIFCIIISGAMIIGVLIAAGALVLHP